VQTAATRLKEVESDTIARPDGLDIGTDLLNDADNLMPGMIGKTSIPSGRKKPSVRWRSVWHTPHASTFSSASPRPGSGIGTSCKTSG
jgi:hypothetical protein